MSKVFKVSRSGYYRWYNSTPSRRDAYNKRLGEQIRTIWKDSHKRYGAPRIHVKLKEAGCLCSRPRVARLMARLGIASQIRKKWVKTTHSNHRYPIAENLLNREFHQQNIGQVWVGDITYIASRQGWLYLTIVMDLGDRNILGWSLSRTMKAQDTSMAAFREAISTRRPSAELMFHSDRGVQYACDAFTGELAHHSITQSMSRKGNCWDNAPAESFFKTLKHELQPGRYANYEEARASLFEFIEIWYNRKRIHSALGYKTPEQAGQIKTPHQAA